MHSGRKNCKQSDMAYTLCVLYALSSALCYVFFSLVPRDCQNFFFLFFDKTEELKLEQNCFLISCRHGFSLIKMVYQHIYFDTTHNISFPPSLFTD